MGAVTSARRVAVTGADGFIGRRVVAALDAADFETVRIVHTDTPTGDITTDLSDPENLADALEANAVACVVHTAWTGHPRASARAYSDSLALNVVPSINVALACGLAGVEHLTFLSSGGGAAQTAGTNRLPAAYGWAKMLSEQALRSTAATFGFQCLNLQPTAVYGPGQDPSKGLGVISVFASRLLDGLPLEVFGSIEARRDFLHVDDLARLIVTCVDQRTAGTFPVGGPDLVSVADVIELLAAAMEATPVVVQRGATGVDPVEVSLDNTLIHEVTGWSPRIHVSRSISEVLIDQIDRSGTARLHQDLLKRLQRSS